MPIPPVATPAFPFTHQQYQMLEILQLQQCPPPLFLQSACSPCPSSMMKIWFSCLFFKKNHFVLFLQVPVSVNLASLNLSFIHALLAATNKNCLSSLQERIHWEDTNPTDLFKRLWIPPPQEAFGALFCALCSHCVLHKVRSPASGRQGSVLELVRLWLVL